MTKCWYGKGQRWRREVEPTLLWWTLGNFFLAQSLWTVFDGIIEFKPSDNLLQIELAANVVSSVNESHLDDRQGQGKVVWI